ncbi:MAG: D-2-hydroxyacid dehydrogenase [Gemmatimonadaceae bacterium]
MPGDERVAVIDFAASAPAWALPPRQMARIRASVPQSWTVRVVETPTISDGDGGAGPSAEVLEAVVGAEVYAGFGIAEAILEAGRDLRWVHSAAAGVGAALSPTMLARDILFTNSAGVHAVPIAEHVTGGLLFLLRSFDIAVDRQREGKWDRESFTGARTTVRELGECRVLIVGAGGVGTEIARRLSAFGARCVGLRRNPRLGTPDGFDRVTGPDDLDAELPASDVLILSVPHTAATNALIDARRLDALPAGAIVVNVARGALLDERALAERIGSGALRGAVLDVFREEPLAESSPLWHLRSVLLTPHVSAVSPGGYWDRELALLLGNWQLYARGEAMKNVVDKRAGY